MVMDDLPCSVFTPVDIGHPLIEADIFAAELGMADLSAHLTGHLAGDGQALSDDIVATWSHACRTASQPISWPPIGCMVVTSAPCDQMSASGPAFPFSMVLSDA